MNKISAEIVADSVDERGNRLTSFLITFPRIILSEINTHRMLSKNTSSSRAIPFSKMVETVQNEPFIPIGFQKSHKGMQGTEYVDKDVEERFAPNTWLRARDKAVEQAIFLHNNLGVTKQLCNRLLEPFMWTTMLITGSREGWENFFNLRCPSYEIKGMKFKSKADAELWFYLGDESPKNIDWRAVNKGQAEIHMMDLAEKIYDQYTTEVPDSVKNTKWHIPFRNKIETLFPDATEEEKVKISVAMAARTSYTVVGEEKDINKEKMIELHNRLVNQYPPHSSPLEHVAKCMTPHEYYDEYLKTNGEILNAGEDYDFPTFSERSHGWCGPYHGFMSYRFLFENRKL